jgi:transglutaminase-like putative cysteine protease
MHAWAEAWVGDRWHSFDVAIDKPIGEAHIKIAIGADYLDACPVRGVRVTSSTGSRTRRQLPRAPGRFPRRRRELRIEVDLVAEMAVYNPFDFFLEPRREVSRSSTSRGSCASCAVPA